MISSCLLKKETSVTVEKSSFFSDGFSFLVLIEGKTTDSLSETGLVTYFTQFATVTPAFLRIAFTDTRESKHLTTVTSDLQSWVRAQLPIRPFSEEVRSFLYSISPGNSGL